MKRSKFSLSNYKLLSCDMGNLIPIGLLEVLPGDSIQQATSALVRASPLLAPVMHPVHVSIRHFFVPHRLVWDDFDDFITGGSDGLNASAAPTLTLTFTAGSPPTGTAITGQLADYLGVPTGAQITVSALPFRGYALIWNEFYRDQDLQAPLQVAKTSGLDGGGTATSRTLQRVQWEKDYFTSARPWEQKGAGITLPLGQRANVKGIGWSVAGSPVTGVALEQTGGTTTTPPGMMTFAAAEGAIAATGTGASAFPDIYADLTGASAITVNLLREAMALQRYQEARARFGSRYTEYLRYLGVRSSDACLQRPEYLGGGRQTIQFSEVLATAEGTSTDVGDLKGHGIASMRSNRYRRFFEEHGFIFSLMYVRPKTMYSQGLKKHWIRKFKEDYWQKELEHIGQAEIYNTEVYSKHTTPDGIFGYQDRYDEYRRTESSIAGEFRESTLNHWHFARDFTADPALNASFVSCVPTERTFAVNTQHVLYVMAHHNIQARRLVAKQGNSFIF